MATMNVSLPDEMKAWVEERAKSGGYQTTSDLVRDLIRRERDRDRAFEEMRAFVQKGIDSGPAEPFDWDALRAERHAAFAARTAKRAG